MSDDSSLKRWMVKLANYVACGTNINTGGGKKKLNFFGKSGYNAAEISVSCEIAAILFHLDCKSSYFTYQTSRMKEDKAHTGEA